MLHQVLVIVGGVLILVGVGVGLYGIYRYRAHCASYENLNKIGSRMPDARARDRENLFEKRIFPLFAGSIGSFLVGGGMVLLGVI